MIPSLAACLVYHIEPWWLYALVQSHTTSPMTGSELESMEVFPNTRLKQVISELFESQVTELHPGATSRPPSKQDGGSSSTEFV
jgi:hypothetical protein